MSVYVTVGFVNFGSFYLLLLSFVPICNQGLPNNLMQSIDYSSKTFTVCNYLIIRIIEQFCFKSNYVTSKYV